MKLSFKVPSWRLGKSELEPAGDDGNKVALFRRLRGLLGWVAAGFGLFLLFVWLTLPTRAIAWRIGYEAKTRGYLVDIEDVSISPFGGMTLENVTWTFEPSNPQQTPSKFVADEVDIDIGVWSLIFGGLDIEVEVEREDGSIVAEYREDEAGSAIKIDIESLPLYDVPKARQSLNAPLMGLLSLHVDLTMPQRKLAKAVGNIQITCASCKIGDGETPLFIPGSKAFQSGVVIPEIDFGTLTGKMEVRDGKAEIVEAIETESDDLRIQMTGSIALKDPFARSVFNLLLKVDVTESLQERSDKIKFLVQTADPKTKLEPPETGMGFKLTGTAGKPRFMGVQAKTAAERRAERRNKQREREEKRRQKAAEREAARDVPPPDAEPSEPVPSEPMGEEPPDNQKVDIQPLSPPIPIPEEPMDDPRGGEALPGEPSEEPVIIEDVPQDRNFGDQNGQIDPEQQALEPQGGTGPMNEGQEADPEGAM